MKKILTITLILAYSVALIGQSILLIEPDTVFVLGSASTEEIKVHASITNTSNDLVTVAWERIVNDIPEAWQSYICSDVVCAPPDVGFGAFGLAAGNTVDLDCYFLPEGQIGQGSVNLQLFITADTTTKYSVFYQTDALVVDTNEPLDSALVLYPNPAKDWLNLEGTDLAIEAFSIFNWKGQRIKGMSNFLEKRIYIGNLIPGNYILQMRQKEDHIYRIFNKL